MKRFIKLTLIGALVFFGSSSAFAQQKFGYVKSQELVSEMMEKESINEQIEKIRQDWVDQLEIMSVEFNTKYEDYQKNVNSYSETIRQVKTRDLQELQGRIQELSQMADQDLQSNYQTLLVPIYDKIQEAIDKVGADGGYFIIFDENTMSYYNKKSLTDVTPAVKKELKL